MPAFLKVISMNVKGSNVSPNVGEDRPEMRRRAIYETVTKHNPHIVFFQEFDWVDIRNGKWGDNALPDIYHRFRHGDTSVMVNKDSCPLNTASNITAVELEDAKPQNPDPNMMIVAAHYDIKILRFQGDFDLICMSWHGPHTGYNNPTKVSYFQNLMGFILNIRRKKGLPMIVGGDFNVKRNLVKDHVRHPFKMVKYRASRERNEKGVIDFFLVTDTFDIQNSGWINLNVPAHILDHNPINISFKRDGILDEHLEGLERLFRAYEPETARVK